MLEACGFDLDLFDIIVISAEHGVKKPSLKLMDLIKDKFPEIKPHEMVMVGD